MSGNDHQRLPPGWAKARLGDVVDVLDRFRVPINSEGRALRPGNIPYYGATGQVGWIDDFLFDEELLLLGEDGAPFLTPGRPKAYMIRGKSWVNNHAHVLRSKAALRNAFLMYQLNQVDFRPFVSGTTRLKLPQGAMVTIPLVIAPEAEQDRIVAEIEKHFTRLDAGVAALKRAQANLMRYRTSVLKAACEGRLVPTEAELAQTEVREYEPADCLLAQILKERRAKWVKDQLAKIHAAGKVPKDDKWKAKYPEPAAPDITDLPELPEGWVIASMDQLTVRITSGSRDWSKYYGHGRGTFLMAQNIRPGRLDLTYRQPVDPPNDDRDRARSQVCRDDLLVTIVGANTGDVCRVAYELREHFVCQSVALMRPVEWHLSPFLTIYMTSEENGQRQYRRYIYGAGRPHLSFDQLKMTAILLPPLAEQHRIVAEVDRRLSVIDEIEAIISTNLKRAERLRQSILKQAFEGKLVPQDSTDEPASVLLERIRVECAQYDTRQRSLKKAAGKPAKKIEKPLMLATQSKLFC